MCRSMQEASAFEPELFSFQSLTTIENGDTFSTIDPDHPEIRRFGKFTETEMIMVSTGEGVGVGVGVGVCVGEGVDEGVGVGVA